MSVISLNTSGTRVKGDLCAFEPPAEELLRAYSSIYFATSLNQIRECQILIVCIYVRKQYNELKKSLLAPSHLKYFQMNFFLFLKDFCMLSF